MSGTLHERLRVATGKRSLKHLSSVTGVPAETVRRFMNGQTPSAEFITALCQKLRISGDWLLTGRGAMSADEARAYALGQADPSELLAAMAATIETLLVRVDRLERYAQTLESRLRASRAREDGNEDDVPPGGRAERVTNAVARRPRDADG